MTYVLVCSVEKAYDEQLSPTQSSSPRACSRSATRHGKFMACWPRITNTYSDRKSWTFFGADGRPLQHTTSGSFIDWGSHHLSNSGRCVRYSLYSEVRFHLQPCCIQSHSPRDGTPTLSGARWMREEHLDYWALMPSDSDAVLTSTCILSLTHELIHSLTH
jgi:hypothetical protein